MREQGVPPGVLFYNNAARIAVLAAVPHIEAAIREKLAAEIEALATAECSERALRREDPEMWAQIDQGREPATHWPDGTPGYPCEGCDAARSYNESALAAAAVARGGSR
jgi:hypothetical protein